jgi:hypothetical protein
MGLEQIDGGRQIKDFTITESKLAFTISASSQVITLTNTESFTIKAGQPVKLVGGGGCALAQANNVSNIAIGLATVDSPTSTLCHVALIGTLSLVNWTDATGGSSTLTDASPYFLSQGAAGVITTVPPDSTGQICQYIGTSLSTGEIAIQIARPMKV